MVCFLVIVALVGLVFFARGRFKSNGNPLDNLPLPKSVEGGITSCHVLDLDCGFKPPEVCTTLYALGDRCRQYAGCQLVKGSCQLEIGQKFNQCKACVEKCLRDSTDPVEQFQCEGNCQ